MTVPSAAISFTYAGDGVTVTWAVPFVVFAPSDLVITLYDTVAHAVVAPAPVLGGGGTYDYTFAGTFDPTIGEYTAGNQITFNTAPPATYSIFGIRIMPGTQGVQFFDNTRFPAKRVEGVIDRLTMICQQLLARAMQIGPNVATAFSQIMPVPAALKVLRFNAAANAIEAVDVLSLPAAVQATEAAAGIAAIATNAEALAGVNDTDFLTPLKGAAATAAATAAQAVVTAANLANALTALVAAENPVVNSDFQVDQQIQVGAGKGDNIFCMDLWKIVSSSGTMTVAQETNPEPGSESNVSILNAGASRFGIWQMIEQRVAQRFKGATVTFRARVKCSIATTIRAGLAEYAGTADIVTNLTTNPASAVYTAGNFFAANTTGTVMGTVAVAANTWTDLIFSGTLGAGFNNLEPFIITEAAVALGTTLRIHAVGFGLSGVPVLMHEKLFDALRRCKRFYRKSYEYLTAPQTVTNLGGVPCPRVVGASTVQGGVAVKFEEPMRAAPSMSLINPATNATGASAVRDLNSATDCTGSTVQNLSKEGFDFSFTTPAGGAVGDRMLVHYIADAHM